MKKEKKKILFIEDELEDFVQKDPFYKKLSYRGFEVDTARTGAEAWRKLMKDSYDLVLLDIMLPPGEPAISALNGVPRLEMGLSILKALRKGEFSQKGVARDVPVVVLTGVSDSRIWDGLEEHIEDPDLCLAKPSEPDDMARAVEKALGREL